MPLKKICIDRSICVLMSSHTTDKIIHMKNRFHPYFVVRAFVAFIYLITSTADYLHPDRHGDTMCFVFTCYSRNTLFARNQIYAFLLPSLNRYLCKWTISLRWYHPPIRKCFGTDMFIIILLETNLYMSISLAFFETVYYPPVVRTIQLYSQFTRKKRIQLFFIL